MLDLSSVQGDGGCRVFGEGEIRVFRAAEASVWQLVQKEGRQEAGLMGCDRRLQSEIAPQDIASRLYNRVYSLEAINHATLRQNATRLGH